MSTQSTIRKVIAATAISAAIGLTSLVGGAASADGPSAAGKMVNVYSYILTHATVVAPPAKAGLTVSASPGAVVDGSIPTETLSLNFDKIPSNR